MNVLTLSARPNQALSFPGLCAHCGQPANQTYPIQKQIAHLIRSIDVPFCHACLMRLRQKSMVEERRQLWGRILSLVLGVLIFAVMLLFSPGTLIFAARLLLALVVGGLGGTAVYTIFQKYSQKGILPEKQNILESAQIEHFDGQIITFHFQNPTFAERFIELNKSQQLQL